MNRDRLRNVPPRLDPAPVPEVPPTVSNTWRVAWFFVSLAALFGAGGLLAIAFKFFIAQF